MYLLLIANKMILKKKDPRFLDLGAGWWCSELHSHATLPLGKEPSVPIGQQATWAPEPV
jgi:hypothetical protein